MKILKYLGLVLILVAAFSCTKNTIEYNAESVTGTAEFQLHYMNPVTSSTTNNITKVEVNGQMYSNTKAPLSTYNAVPSGSVGRFFSVTPGTVNLKLYQGTDMATLVYDKNVTLVAGKQNIFVHDFTQDPKVFDNGYPYIGNTTENSDSTCWIKFYNFLYENITAGPPVVYNPSTLKLQYQYLDSRTGLAVNIGAPVAFGETTGWVPVTVLKSVAVSSGSRTITFKIKTVDAGGNIVGDLSVINSSGVYSAYTGTLTCFIGRRYHNIIAGLRADKTVPSSVRTFTAL